MHPIEPNLMHLIEPNLMHLIEPNLMHPSNDGIHLATENKKYEIKIFEFKKRKKIAEWAKKSWDVYVKTGEGEGVGQSKGMHS